MDMRILGSSPQARTLQKLIEQAATVRAPVLITGERGTGRHFTAAALHTRSGRPGSFETLSCKGLDGGVLMEQVSARLQAAGGGTLFLDDIDEAAADVQAELVRYHEQGTFGTTRADVRIIFSAARSLEPAVQRGEFRSELLRAIGIRIQLPALRERRMDIPVLAEQFLREFEGGAARGISTSVLRKLMSYSWPGNVRELRDVVERAAAQSRNSTLALEDIAFLITSAEERPLQFLVPGATIQEIEKEAILRTLEYTGGSTTAAARVLHMSVRKIQYKLKQYRRAGDIVPAGQARAAGAAD